jgi:hypothetical protein
MPFPYDLFRGISAPQSNSPIDRRDLLNYTGDNTIQSSRYINPLTRDFDVSVTNHLQGQNAVEQAVMLAINTTFNSSSQTAFGQNFGAIKLITPQIQSQVSATVQQALGQLIQNKQITLRTIQFVNNGLGQISVQFSYNNNTLGTTATQSFILQG